MSVNFELLAQSHAKLCLFKVQKSDASIRPLFPNPVTIDDNAIETIDDVTPVVALHGINLLTSDIALLESQHGWLNHKLIDVGQKTLQAKFPETEGLNDVGC